MLQKQNTFDLPIYLDLDIKYLIMKLYFFYFVQQAVRCGRQICCFALIAAHWDIPAEGSAGGAGAADTSGPWTVDAGARTAHLGD